MWQTVETHKTMFGTEVSGFTLRPHVSAFYDILVSGTYPFLLFHGPVGTEPHMSKPDYWHTIKQ